jgi:ribosomal protein L24E
MYVEYRGRIVFFDMRKSVKEGLNKGNTKRKTAWKS